MSRVVLITGGSRGIGLACAQRFAELGDQVAVTYNSSPPPEGFFGVQCDVTSTESVDAAFAAVEAQFGPVEVLVSNAGVTNDGLLLRMKETDFTSVIDANLTAAFRVTKRASQGMLRARKGRIILMSSVVALLGSAGQANYAASKAGLVGFARSVARELGSRSITCNVVAPGPVETDMTAALQALEQNAPARFTALWRLAVFGYYSRPEVIAAIQHDLAPAYHGAPLPLGYAHAIEPWDASHPHNFPTTPRGHYLATDAVQRVDLSQIPADLLEEPAVTTPPDLAAVEATDTMDVDAGA